MRELYEHGNRWAQSGANGDGSCGLPSLSCVPVLGLPSFSMLCLGAVRQTLIVMAIIMATDHCTPPQAARLNPVAVTA
jgi:hypothetical protein